MSFELHPQLARDSVLITRLALSELRLINDGRLPWVILVPMRAGIVEWFDLSPIDQQTLHQETMRVAQWLKNREGSQLYSKINIGALGNIVRQLHIHLIARHENDACWPRPVWGSAMEPMPEQQLEAIRARMQAELEHVVF